MLEQRELKLIKIKADLESQEYDSAINSLYELLEEKDYCPEAVYLLAQTAFLNGNLDAAENLSQELLLEDPDNQSYLSLYRKTEDAIQENKLTKPLLTSFDDAYQKKEFFNILKYGYQLLKYKSQALRTHTMLADTLFTMGKARLAHNHILKALEIDPHNKGLLSCTVSYLHYTHDSTNAEVKHFAEIYGQKAFPEYQGKEYTEFPLLNLQEKKLRIGFISGDFKSHVVVLWIGNLIPKLQENGLDIFCYCNNEKDSITEIWSKQANHWRDIQNLNDIEAAKLIHQDQINILIDLSGHTALNRLGVMALRPAPVQACWLGNSGPIGLKSINCCISDVKHVPKEDDIYLEKIYRLPKYASSFNVVEAFNLSQEKALVPYKKNGFITFGCLSNMIKLNTNCFDIWVKILKTVPNSRLYLCNHALQQDDTHKYIKNYFYHKGINDKQLILEGATNKNRNEYLNYYNNIDVYLDSFPLGASTTCIDSAFMGVPVIGLRGERILHRMSAEIMNTLGHEELIAENYSDYIKKAVEFSLSPDLIDYYRNQLRESLFNSVIVNVNDFAKDFTEALKSMWSEFCKV
jgi:predicted O-linked N-acetylglucosamine transferase (SPINDLY family)